MNARTIPRKKKEVEGPDSFESLRREGIALAQELSGELWTDYNLHDPGLTILEHVCFALTDLIYRTEFPIQDLLTSDDGVIDWQNLALHPPQEILSCRPTTAADLRKAILDTVPSIDNVWLETDRGLYTISLRPAAGLSSTHATEIIRQVRHAFHANRNLCEDVGDVVILQEYDFELIAAIDISADAEPSDILSQIYYECARYLSAAITTVTYQDALTSGAALDSVFDGPLLKHGMISQAALGATPNEDRTDLYGIIRNISGVEQVRSVHLTPIGGAVPPQEKNEKQPMRLRIPHRSEEIKIAVFKGSSALPVSFPAVLAGYNKLNFREKSLRHAPQDPAEFIAMPQGQHRNLRQYVSIQKDFPAIYGIGAFGLPESDPPLRHAQALQLKAYLLLFEQVMANFLANLQNVRQLFSILETGKSYASQRLGNTAIPNIDMIYAKAGKAGGEVGVMTEYDRQKYPDRKSRLLDYQLALYGDSLTQFSLRQFDCYHGVQDRESEIVRNKTALLENIVQINKDRAAAFNLTAPSWNTRNISGLAAKVSLLLGLRYSHERSLTDVFVERGLDLVPEADIPQGSREGSAELEYVDLSDIQERVTDPFRSLGPVGRGKLRQSLFENVGFLRSGVVSESILRYGIRRDRYKVGAVGDRSLYQVAVNVSDEMDDEGRWLYQATYADKRRASQAANALRHFLIDLNMESEGLHIVEHILLRPEGFGKGDAAGNPDDFFPFRISVIFPSWPARFHDEEFRKLAEDTVRLNCVAHVHPEIHWFGFRKMREFELLQMRWLNQLNTAEASGENASDAAAALVRFLRQNRRQS